MSGAVFDRIYTTNGWNGIESRSGPGSGLSATARVSAAIVDLVSELGIDHVLDVGCGDGYWMPDLPGYVGCDVSEEAIALARQRHPDRTYYIRDVGPEGAPDTGLQTVSFKIAFDLILSRDAMQHLPLPDVLALIVAFQRSGAAWLLASTYIPGLNRSIAAGDYFEPDLMAAPFLLGRPERLIPDGYSYSDPDAIRDPRKFLGLWRLTM